MGIFENEVPVNVKSSHQKESRSAEVNQRCGQPVEKRPVWLHNQTGRKVNEG